MLELIESLMTTLLVPTGRGRGRQFRLAYSWGHPEFPVGDSDDAKGGLTITKEGVEYTRERGENLIFRIPQELISSARRTHDEEVAVSLALRGQSVEMGFRAYGARRTKEVDRFLRALRERYKLD